MYFAKRMLAQNYPLPVPFEKPSAYTSTLVASTSGATYKIYDVPPEAGGWYRVVVSGAGGCRGHDQTGANGGGTSAIVYVYGGSKVLLWSGNTGAGGTGSSTYSGGACGYPSPSGQGGTNYGSSGAAGVLGGGGAGGSDYRGAGGGGGAAGAGGASGYKAGAGGAGSGCIIGVLGNAASTIGIHTVQPWAVGTYKVDAVTAMVLSGGGGGGYGDSGARSGGAGGGAWGNGGNNTAAGAGGAGPGGASFGVGQATTGVTGGNAGAGAWCVRDFTTGSMLSGLGGGAAQNTNGATALYRLNTPTGTATYRLRVVFEPRDIETRAEFMVNGDITPGCELDTFNTTEHWVTPNSLGGGTVAIGGSLLIKIYDAYGEHTLATIDLTAAVISGGIIVHADNSVTYSNSEKQLV